MNRRGILASLASASWLLLASAGSGMAQVSESCGPPDFCGNPGVSTPNVSPDVNAYQYRMQQQQQQWMQALDRSAPPQCQAYNQGYDLVAIQTLMYQWYNLYVYNNANLGPYDKLTTDALLAYQCLQGRLAWVQQSAPPYPTPER